MYNVVDVAASRVTVQRGANEAASDFLSGSKRGVSVGALCVWPLDCEKNRPFEAFGFWNRESGQMKPNVVCALSACRCLGCSGSSAPLLPQELRIRRIFALIQDVASCRPLGRNNLKVK